MRKISSKSRVKFHYRLPTEEEWEYAARAGTRAPVYWSGGASVQCRYANARDISSNQIFGDHGSFKANCTDGYAATSPAGAFPSNPWGLFDMLGDAYQWTSSCFHSYKDPGSGIAALRSISCEIRMVRGASWSTIPFDVRVASRGGIGQANRSSTTGFRVAADMLN
ncbi:formylglycine-generating enzyme required for sulfatase activity [Paraburkholderia sp. EB58]|jgi:sulfatase modifying factor 1|uniref:formylglycine-generating enzyme family protein n=1 Tax=Paraburkholderia sp. EB58 TaxID=3035125 RepID=UPI003D1F7BE7